MACPILGALLWSRCQTQDREHIPRRLCRNGYCACEPHRPGIIGFQVVENTLATSLDLDIRTAIKMGPHSQQHPGYSLSLHVPPTRPPFSRTTKLLPLPSRSESMATVRPETHAPISPDQLQDGFRRPWLLSSWIVKVVITPGFPDSCTATEVFLRFLTRETYQRHALPYECGSPLGSRFSVLLHNIAVRMACSCGTTPRARPVPRLYHLPAWCSACTSVVT